jgi:hypothetical protein
MRAVLADISLSDVVTVMTRCIDLRDSSDMQDVQVVTLSKVNYSFHCMGDVVKNLISKDLKKKTGVTIDSILSFSQAPWVIHGYRARAKDTEAGRFQVLSRRRPVAAISSNPQSQNRKSLASVFKAFGHRDIF